MKLKILPGILLFIFIGCVKKSSDQTAGNTGQPECNDLVIRKVIYNASLMNKPPSIHITLENTCRSCIDNWVYLGLFMIEKNTGDTVASTCISCLGVVKNRQSGVYELNTSLTSLPDLKNIRFSYDYLCTDVPYRPK